MTQINVTLDVFGILIGLILLFHMMVADGLHDPLSRIFAGLCLCNSGMMLGDLTNWLCEGFARLWYPALLWMGSLLTYVCGLLALIAFTAYVVCRLSGQTRVHPAFLCGIGAFGATNLICLLLSQWNGMFYYIDAQNVYQRGEWFWFLQLSGIMILLLDAAIVVCYRRHLRPREVYSFLEYAALPAVAMVVQYFCYGLSLSYPAGTLVLLILFMNVQSELEWQLKAREKELADSNIAMMLSRIQPRFLFRTLAAIRRLCGEDPAQAKAAVGAFATYLRGNMDSIFDRERILFERELLHVQCYLALEQQRLGEKLQVDYEIGPRDFLLPSLTLQPIVESILHNGARRRPSCGHLRICTETDGDAYRIVVAGCVASRELVSAQTPGIHSVRGRLNDLSGGTLTLDTQPDRVTATIRIPR